ncbi:hypothetical protein GUY60_31750, partial [Streptomyces sp. YC537]|nr:hypothetical protein [Streptomyces boluensis]
MSDTDNTGGGVDNGGGWQPTPQGEFDADATAFVRIPEGFGLADFEEGGQTGTPLAAPGGYAPPHISVTGGAATDPSATSAFLVPPIDSAPEAVSWPEPNAPQPPPVPEPTGQWSFTDAAAPDPYGQDPYGQAPYGEAPYGQAPFAGHQGYDSAPQPGGYAPQDPSGYAPQDPSGYGQQQGPLGYEHGQDFTGYAPQDTSGYTPAPAYDEAAQSGVTTGQWSIPVVEQGELPDESGEFTQSALIEQWGGEAPATLPGGAAAPWATPEPVADPVPEPVAEVVPEPAVEPVTEPVVEPVVEAVAEPVVEAVAEPVVEVAEPVADVADVEPAAVEAVTEAPAEDVVTETGGDGDGNPEAASVTPEDAPVAAEGAPEGIPD